MPPLFHLIRIGVFVTVLLWTFIVLGIAIHFHGILLTNDLTRFIPFAIFVSAATIVLLLALLLFGLRKANPISTRIELGCLGLDGVLWLVLAAFLITSDAEEADVECFTSSSSSDQTPIEMPGFTTEIYQAQYRVLEAFSLFNVILIWGFLLFLLFLAWRHHSHGERTVWTTPVTSVPWFYSSDYAVNEKEAKLPPPVTAPVDRSRSRGAGALDLVKDVPRAKPQDLGKIRTTGLTPPPKRSQQSYEYKHGYWLPRSADAPPAPPPPPKPSVSRSNTRTKSKTRRSSQDRGQGRGTSQERGRDTRTSRDRGQAHKSLGSDARGRTRQGDRNHQDNGNHRHGKSSSLTRGNSSNKRPGADRPPRGSNHRNASPRL